MITIKTLKAFEQDTMRELKQFSKRHPYIFYIFISIIFLLIIIDIFLRIEMGMAYGGCIIYESGNQFCTWWLAPVDILIALFIRIIPLYIIYRLYLQYKHDNL